jgi:hypothetical protein
MRSEITVNPNGMTPGKPFRNKTALATSMATAAVAIAVGGALLTGILDRIEPEPPVPEQVLNQALPDAASFDEKSDPLPHFSGYDGSGKLVGTVMFTDHLPPSVQGYLGQVGCAVGLTPDGRITAIFPFRHDETPYYMEMVTASGLLQQMAGIDMGKPFPALDAISGATITSRAIIKDVRLSATVAARNLYSIDVPEPETGSVGSVPLLRESLLAATLLLALATGLMGDRWFRRQGIGLISLIVVGVILNTPLTLSALSRIFRGNLPSTGNWALLFILLYILISSPLQGRTYCRYVCPFGTLQQLCNRLSPLQIRVSAGVNSWLPVVKRTFTSLLIVVGVWGGMAGFTEVEPFFGLFSFTLTPIIWVVVIFILIVSIFWRRFWCNTLCPTGTLLALLCRVMRPRKGQAHGKSDETV